MFDEIIEQIKRQGRNNKIHQTAIDELILYRADYLAESQIYMQEAGVYAVFQGEKTLRIGNQTFCFKAGNMMLYHTNLPIVTERLCAEENKPYLALCFKLNETELNKLIRRVPESCFGDNPPQRTFAQISDELTAVFSRLLNLLDNPKDTEFLLPAFRQEIYYYLLKSPLGAQLAKLFDKGRQFQPIRQAINWLEKHFAEPLDVDQLAKQVGMSHTNFFRRFKEMTGFSPLQYQKSLRLIEASQLLKQANAKVTNVAFQVGYESAAQFSREYKRYFGVSPKQENIATDKN